MANILIPNNPLPVGGTNSFQCIWHLTRAMKAAGWTTVAHSNGVTKVSSGDNNNDSWGNNANPLLDSYPAFNAAVPWIVMRGPSTFKIPITTAPVGNPLRGEKITQGATEGELIGYVFDSGSASGWMVVAPRVGSFNTSSDISCETSGATFTPTGTIVEFVREIVFSKYTSADNANGQMFYICADVVSENAQLFSTLAASAGCTAVVCPGGGGTGNTFPTVGIVIRGIGGQMTGLNGAGFMGTLATGFVGSYHVGCANATPGSDTSPDGSFFALASNSGTALGLAGFIFTRMDDGDPGDCDPYVFCHNNGTGIASYSRTTSISYGLNQYPLYGTNVVGNGTYPCFMGYQARGCPVTSRDIAVPYTGSGQTSGTNTFTYNINYPTSARTVNHPANNPPLIRDSLLVYCAGFSTGSLKHYKGRARWIYLLSQGNILDTFDNKRFICVGSMNSALPAVVVGPWDGSTTPIA